MPLAGRARLHEPTLNQITAARQCSFLFNLVLCPQRRSALVRTRSNAERPQGCERWHAGGSSAGAGRRRSYKDLHNSRQLPALVFAVHASHLPVMARICRSAGLAVVPQSEQRGCKLRALAFQSSHDMISLYLAWATVISVVE